MDDRKINMMSKSGAIYLETLGVTLVALSSLFMQYGRLDYTILISNHSILTILGSLCFWFVNRFTLEYILQSRIESNKVTYNLPFELLAASMVVTSIFYIVVYLIFNYLEKISFSLTNFLQGYIISFGLTLLIVILYVGGQIWKSWWRDGDFLFNLKDKNVQAQNGTKDFITIKNSRGSVNFGLQEVLYFISESKITFLVDISGKKRVTQYNLSELEEILDGRFFR